MKATAIILLLMFVAFIANAQHEIESRMLKGVDVKPPVFTGVEGTMKVLESKSSASIYDYLRSSVRYPDFSESIKREGVVVLQFTVLPSGNLDDFVVINSVSADVDAEVIRALKSTNGMWKPGQNNNIPVAMEKEIAIAFQIENSDHLRIAQTLFKRASKKLLKNKQKRALKLLDRALVYQPYSEAILLRRGITRFATGNKEGACKDWNRMKSLGYDVSDAYLKNCEMEAIAIKDK